MKKLPLLLAAFILVACGGADNSAQGENAMGISAVTIETSSAIVRVGEPVQLTLKVTLTSGQEVYGIKDIFNNPETGDSYMVDWTSSDVRFARIDNYGMLTPRFEGFITVTAEFGFVSRTREMRVDNTLENTAGLPLPDENAAVDEDIDLDQLPDPDPDPDPELSQYACQGHAFAVVSFTPGANAGFGSANMPNIVLGPPEGTGDGAGSLDVVSLGQFGEIVLDLDECEIEDGPGADFIVSENAFYIAGNPLNPFHELAAVAVSWDGINFTEFTCNDAGYPFDGCAGVQPVYSNSTNAISPFDVSNAGGDHFDLETIGVYRARYVRIRDLGSQAPWGDIAGFDLDAITVVNGLRYDDLPQ